MHLTKPQQQRFWRDWTAARKVQGWTKDRGWTDPQADNERRALLARAGFESLTEVDPGEGFDRVLAELAALTNPADIEPQLRAQEQPLVRLRYSCRELSARIHKLNPSSASSADAYMTTIMHAKFGTWDLDTLTAPQLLQLRNTLSARLAAKKKTTASNQPF